jgi:type II secretion system protein N
MLRALLFLVAFVVGVTLSAPLERWLLPFVQGPLRDSGIELHLESLRFALPAGLRARGLHVSTPAAGADVESLYVGITRAFVAEACGGTLDGQVRGDSIVLRLRGVDLSRCLRNQAARLEGTLDGSISVEGMSWRSPGITRNLRAEIELRSPGGVFSGTVPAGGATGSATPLGEWEFSDLVLEASLLGGELSVREGTARTGGVEWELLGATFRETAGRTDVRLDFRARQREDTPRSRALLGLLPQAGENPQGWRRYRVVGSLGATRVIGLQ